ncbi:MAG TPA: hypothetical protein VF202_04425 [Trueperaceae bacterium]
MSEQGTAHPLPADVAEQIPRRLRLRHLSLLLDEKPSVIRYWLDSGILPSQQRGFAGHRWVDPNDAITFAVAEGIPPERLNWRGVVELELGMDADEN